MEWLVIALTVFILIILVAVYRGREHVDWFREPDPDVIEAHARLLLSRDDLTADDRDMLHVALNCLNADRNARWILVVPSFGEHGTFRLWAAHDTANVWQRVHG